MVVFLCKTSNRNRRNKAVAAVLSRFLSYRNAATLRPPSRTDGPYWSRAESPFKNQQNNKTAILCEFWVSFHWNTMWFAKTCSGQTYYEDIQSICPFFTPIRGQIWLDILKRIVRKLERKQRNKGAVLKEPFFLTAVEPLAWSFTFPILRSAFRTLSKSRIHSSGQGYTLLSVVSGGTKAAFSCSKNATKMQQNAAKMQQNATVRLSE